MRLGHKSPGRPRHHRASPRREAQTRYQSRAQKSPGQGCCEDREEKEGCRAREVESENAHEHRTQREDQDAHERRAPREDKARPREAHEDPREGKKDRAATLKEEAEVLSLPR